MEALWASVAPLQALAAPEKRITLITKNGQGLQSCGTRNTRISPGTDSRATISVYIRFFPADLFRCQRVLINILSFSQTRRLHGACDYKKLSSTEVLPLVISPWQRAVQGGRVLQRNTGILVVCSYRPLCIISRV